MSDEMEDSSKFLSQDCHGTSPCSKSSCSPVMDMNSLQLPDVSIASQQPPDSKAKTHLTPVLNLESSRSPVLNIVSRHSSVLNTESPRSPVFSFQSRQALFSNTDSPRSPVLNFKSRQALASNTESPRSPVLNFKSREVPVFSTESPRSPVLNFKSRQAPVFNTESSRSPVLNFKSRQAPVFSTESPRSPVLNFKSRQAPVLNPESSRSPVLNIKSQQTPVLNTESLKSPVLNTRKPSGSSHDCSHEEILAMVASWNIDTCLENEETELITNLEPTRNKPEHKLGCQCVLPNVFRPTVDHSCSSSSLQIDHCNTLFSAGVQVSQALEASIPSPNKRNVSPCIFPKNSYSVKKNSEKDNFPAPQVIELPLPNEAIPSTSWQDEKRVLPPGSVDNTLKLGSRKEETVKKIDSNVLKLQYGCSMPQFDADACRYDVLPSGVPSEVNVSTETVSNIALSDDIQVIHITDDDSNEPMLQICMSPDHELPKETCELVPSMNFYQSIDKNPVVGNNQVCSEEKSTVLSNKSAFTISEEPDMKHFSSSSVMQLQQAACVDVTNGAKDTHRAQSATRFNYFVEKKMDEIRPSPPTSPVLIRKTNMRTHAPGNSGPKVKRVFMLDEQPDETKCMGVTWESQGVEAGTVGLLETSTNLDRNVENNPTDKAEYLKTVRCTSLTEDSSIATTGGCDIRIESTESVFQNLPETEIISEPAKCMLPFKDQDKDVVKHLKQCKTVKCAFDLRTKLSALLQSLPMGSIAFNIVNQVIGSRVCKEFLLGVQCTTEPCLLSHNVELNFDIPDYTLPTLVNTFSRWYFSQSSLPNFRVLLHLLSVLTREFGDDLLISILVFCPALLRVAPNFRRPLGIKLIEKLVHLLNFTTTEAVRTILTFIVTPDSSEADITEALYSLGVLETEMTNLFDSISCVWHINPKYSFPPNLLFAMLKECLLQMPSEFKDTKEKIIEEILKLPRSEVRKNFHIVDRILLKYFALNSFAAHKVRSFVIYGIDPENESCRVQRYQTSKVKSTGPICYKWNSLDLNELREKKVQLELGKMLLGVEEVETPVVEPPELEIEELVDDIVGDNLALLDWKPHIATSKIVRRIENYLMKGKYKRAHSIIFGPDEEMPILEVVGELHDVLVRLGSKLPLAIYECLTRKPLGNIYELEPHYEMIRDKFIVIVNSVVMTLYSERDFKGALKVLITLDACQVEPELFLPEGVTLGAFAIACSEVHLECRRFAGAVEILLKDGCLEGLKYNSESSFDDNLLSLERLVLKLMESLLVKRKPDIASDLFWAVFAEQESLFDPIDISRYCEFVLSHSFEAGCDSSDSAHLYILIYRVCTPGLVLSPTTLRSVLVELVRTKAPEAVLIRILKSCIHHKVYSKFTPGSITLGTNLLLEEMVAYLLRRFRAQAKWGFSRPCKVRLVKKSNPRRAKYPFLEELRTESTTVESATSRFHEALKRLLGPIYPTIELSNPSVGEIVIPIDGLKVIVGTLLPRDSQKE
ncbi:hypothetical protein GE061_014293 [Apolygus lucorum]|uniref:Uncharacterized protein n=1 Tax=Apolygus lucorum TaxID=248454 RepID=A0A8S9XSH6_APOLU|nr:hypothetical protein GE061_014293 [Apolygus lucorum]